MSSSWSNSSSSPGTSSGTVVVIKKERRVRRITGVPRTYGRKNPLGESNTASSTPTAASSSTAAATASKTVAIATAASSSTESVYGLELSAYEQKLAFSEWIHDWWNGYRNMEGGQEVNHMILEALNKAVPRLTEPQLSALKILTSDDEPTRQAKLKAISVTTNDLMSSLYGSHITVSTIEDSTVTAFEDTVDYLSRPSPEAVVTYEDILNNTVDIAGKRVMYRSITLNPGNMVVKTLSAAQKGVIRDAIKLFMSGRTDGRFYLSFDAAGKDVTKIFRDDANTVALIMPANIADSATSSVRKLGKDENVFYFPKDATSKRNTLTKSTYEIKFVDQGFSPLTPFAFNYEVYKNSELVGTSSFGDKITQGPSLDTLMKNHIDAYNGRDFRNSGSSGCLDIAADFSTESVAGIQADVKAGRSIFQSAKMCGDGDQVDELELAERDLQDPAGTFVFVSADRQAVLERRLRKGAAILHYSGTFTLYRNDKGVSPEDIAAYNALKSKKFVDDNTSLYNAIYDSINKKVTELLVELSTIALDFKHMSTIVRTLFGNRMKDIKAYLEKIQAVPHPAARIVSPSTPSETDIKAVYAKFEEAGIPISTLIYLNKVVNSKNKAYPFLRFSLEDYKTLAVQIAAATATMKSVRPVRIPEDFFSHLTQKEGYTETVDTLLESFFDPSFLTPDILTALKLPEPNQTDQDTVTRFIEADRIFSEISVTKRTKDEIESHKVLLRGALTASTSLRTQLNGHFTKLVNTAGGGSRQIGGARPEPDVLDKVLEVLKEASIFFNQRNLELENDVITINDDEGQMTVAKIKTSKNDRKPLLNLINRISPSDAATHAGDLLNRLKEIPAGDETINYIKLLLDPFNDDANGYIKSFHPIAKYKSLGYARTNIEDSAKDPNDYVLSKIEVNRIGPITRGYEGEIIKGEEFNENSDTYSPYYDLFPDIAETIETTNKEKFRDLINMKGPTYYVSEYFKAAYYLQIDGLITLAILNDLIERNFAENKSLLFNYLPKLGIRIPSIDIATERGWGAIPGKLEALFLCVVDGKLSSEVVDLLSGGKRKNRKTRRRNNKKNNKNTTRLTRRRKH